MKTTVALVAAAIAAGSTSAFAQDQPVAPPQTVQSAPATSAVPGKPTPAPASEERLHEVKFMEEVLASAVRAGAADLARRMQQASPNSLIVVDTAHARGIALDGYGVVFDVDVPLMNLSIVTTLREGLVNDLRDQIREIDRDLARATNATDVQQLTLSRKMLQAQLQMMDPRALGNTILAQNPANANGLAAPVANAQPPGTVSAATADALAPVGPIETKDTNELYSDAVKRSLIDTMLNHSGALRLADDEWLTVAARDNAGSSIPGALNDRSGILLRVKGSDLIAFQRGQITRDEVMKRLEIREWR